jgi:hypothetical protein
VTCPDSVLLIEEPETHVHPELQRNLVRVIYEEAKGQTFITTHSPVLLDAGLASTICRVEHDGRCSTVARCCTPSDLCRVLDQLDVRASDVLQSNFVVWVEGPTDRMFLKRCFELVDARLAEGVGYQIVYYGGWLRSHYTFDELEPDLVNLLRLCRNATMVCDSDRRQADADEIDGPKLRLRRECEGLGGFYWVTDGREIENYLPDHVLSTAYTSLFGRPVQVVLGRFEKLGDVLIREFAPGAPGDGWKVHYEKHKARVMPHLLAHLTAGDLGRWGLADRLKDLVVRIRQANGKSGVVDQWREPASPDRDAGSA